MSAGNERVEKIMMGIQNSIKDGVNHQNCKNYNVIYEALWDLVNEADNLRTKLAEIIGQRDKAYQQQDILMTKLADAEKLQNWYEGEILRLENIKINHRADLIASKERVAELE